MIAITALLIGGIGVVLWVEHQDGPIIILGFPGCNVYPNLCAAALLLQLGGLPTSIRSSGSGLAYGAGRLANVAGPVLIAFLFTHLGYIKCRLSTLRPCGHWSQ